MHKVHKTVSNALILDLIQLFRPRNLFALNRAGFCKMKFITSELSSETQLALSVNQYTSRSFGPACTTNV